MLGCSVDWQDLLRDISCCTGSYHDATFRAVFQHCAPAQLDKVEDGFEVHVEHRVFGLLKIVLLIQRVIGIVGVFRHSGVRKSQVDFANLVENLHELAPFRHIASDEFELGNKLVIFVIRRVEVENVYFGPLAG